MKKDFVDTAREIAVHAHHGQYRRRKNGTPTNVAYITHPERVAAHFEDDPKAQAVAWLHDVLEDTRFETPKSLLDEDIPITVVEAVVAMTKVKNEMYFNGYLTRVKANPLARKVKIRDIIDNLADDPTDTQIEKYVQALNYLL